MVPVLFLLLFIRCEDERFQFPYVNFDVTFNISTQLSNITMGQSVIKNEKNNYGYAGLIIYRLDEGTFRAFDLACTYKPEDRCALERDQDFDNLFHCPCCNSEFMINDIDGNATVFNGPAKWPLREYRTQYMPPNQLRVYSY